MNRRSFLSLITGALAADPERALWVPGAKLISVPRPLQPGFVFTIPVRYIPFSPEGFHGCIDRIVITEVTDEPSPQSRRGGIITVQKPIRFDA